MAAACNFLLFFAHEMDSWLKRLCLFGFQGPQQRQQALLNVLEANSADALDFLVFDTPVCEWDEISILTNDERKFLENVSKFEKNIEPLRVIFLTSTFRLSMRLWIMQFQTDCSAIRGKLDTSAQVMLLPSE